MMVAAFRNQDGLLDALGRLRANGIGPLQTYTPAPLPEAEEAGSPIPLIILIGGVVGALASLGLQTYSSVWAYPLNIGGRPDFAWASFIPTIFENAVLVAILAGFVAFFVLNRMPHLYDPVDEAEAMRRASADRWCLAIRSDDPALLDRVRPTLSDAVSIEEVAS